MHMTPHERAYQHIKRIRAKNRNAIEYKLKAINIKLIFQWNALFYSVALAVHMQTDNDISNIILCRAH